MAKRKVTPPPSRTKSTVLTSETLARQTEEFLKAGGTIEKVERGVSGYSNMMGGKSHYAAKKPEK